MDAPALVLEWEIEPAAPPVEVTVETPTPDHLYFEIIEIREDDLATLASF